MFEAKCDLDLETHTLVTRVTASSPDVVLKLALLGEDFQLIAVERERNREK